jgi:hypothetical protein
VVGRGDHLVERGGDDERQALPAMLGIAGQRRPAAVDEGPVGLAVAVRRADLPVVPAAALQVRRRVDGRQHAAGELACLFEHLARGVGIEVREGRRRGPRGRRAQHVFEDEAHVAQRRGVVPHQGSTPFTGFTAFRGACLQASVPDADQSSLPPPALTGPG